MGLEAKTVRVETIHTECIHRDNQMTDKIILRLPVVMFRTGLSRSSIYDRIKKSEFPKPINLGPRAVGWIAGEIEEWIQSRIDASRSAEHPNFPTS